MSPLRHAFVPAASRLLALLLSFGGLAGGLAAPVRDEDAADEPSPFSVTPSVVFTNGAATVTFAFHVPAHHHIYSDRMSFELDSAPAAVSLPPPKRTFDKFSKGERDLFDRDFTVTCRLPEARSVSAVLAVTLQGCSESECYFPETHQWTLRSDNSIVADTDPDETQPASVGAPLLGGFHVAARASGFIGGDQFLRFLDRSQGTGSAAQGEFGGLSGVGIWGCIGLILLGGLALNLTPCVLPMIPINLAILGAGMRNQSRRRGFLLGSSYGAGMALVYGLLGVAVVLTGSKFGALNGSSWFNLVIAGIFIVLGMGMFDKVPIDFSRFQRSGGRPGSSQGAVLAAGMMGSLSALLAGACVAPVVISVLLLAATFYQRGNILGLCLPFVLGLGMALPWPFAGAGLSFLPKPGAWMTRVKHGFGILILAFAGWYGWLAWSLSDLGHGGGMVVMAKSGSAQELRSALERSRATGRPVVVDFWASWCKNCEAMEHATFRNDAVRRRLNKDFILVRFRAERLNDPELKPVLDAFGVMGLPTCVVVSPDSKKAGLNPSAASSAPRNS